MSCCSNFMSQRLVEHHYKYEAVICKYQFFMNMITEFITACLSFWVVGAPCSLLLLRRRSLVIGALSSFDGAPLPSPPVSFLFLSWLSLLFLPFSLFPRRMVVIFSSSV